MATTYDWDINQVELVSTNGFNQVVHKCFWKCTATADSGASKEQHGVIELDLSTLNPDSFVQWPVDKEQIIEWVKGVVHKDSVEAGLHPEVTTHSFVENAGPEVIEPK